MKINTFLSLLLFLGALSFDAVAVTDTTEQKVLSAQGRGCLSRVIARVRTIPVRKAAIGTCMAVGAAILVATKFLLQEQQPQQTTQAPVETLYPDYSRAQLDRYYEGTALESGLYMIAERLCWPLRAYPNLFKACVAGYRP